MKIVNRLIYVVLILLLIFVSVLGFLGSLGLLPNLATGIYQALTNPSLRWIVTLVSAVLTIAGIYLLGMAFRWEQQSGAAVVTQSSLGDISITLNAFESLVRRSAKQVEGVRDLKPSVVAGRDGINIRLRVTTMPEVNIPQVSDQLQETVKHQVEALTGVQVQNVKVVVEDISYDLRTRVE